MKGLLSLVASLFLVLGTMTGSMAHAAEIGGGKSAFALAAGCASSFKETKDTAQQGKNSSSEDGKSLVKFHGCHGHHVGMAVEPVPGDVLQVKVEILPAGPSTGLAPPTFIGTFRPPIA